VSEPPVESIGVCWDTYLVFEFGDELAGEIGLCVVILLIFVLFFAEPEGERVGDLSSV